MWFESAFDNLKSRWAPTRIKLALFWAILAGMLILAGMDNVTTALYEPADDLERVVVTYPITIDNQVSVNEGDLIPFDESLCLPRESPNSQRPSIAQRGRGRCWSPSSTRVVSRDDALRHWRFRRVFSE